MTRRQFHIRPYDPNRVRKPRSAAQEAATARAFTIARLRGLWYLVGVLSHRRAQLARELIDADLRDLGAESQSFRRAREREELEAELAVARAERSAEKRRQQGRLLNIPF